MDFISKILLILISLFLVEVVKITAKEIVEWIKRMIKKYLSSKSPK